MLLNSTWAVAPELVFLEAQNDRPFSMVMPFLGGWGWVCFTVSGGTLEGNFPESTALVRQFPFPCSAHGPRAARGHVDRGAAAAHGYGGGLQDTQGGAGTLW